MSPLERQYQDTLDFLFTKLPMYSRIGSAAYKKDLTNTIKLCTHLGNPESQFKSIHVGGTNGKGSTSNYLASIYIEAGLKVGVYTSPHLIDFRERIKIGHKLISKEFVIDFVNNLKPLIEEIEPSFFEITVAMAFSYFAHQNVDLAIIEVGLGGRLDSTNVIQPILSVVTNVSFDHVSMLGDTLQKIAFEKAGIVKQNIPIIIGESDERYDSVFEEKAKRTNSKISYASKRIQFVESGTFHYEDIAININKNSLKPLYQIKNIKTAILAFLTSSKELNLPSNDKIVDWIEKGIEHRTQNTGFLGRWTELEFRNRKFILESAHNEAGIRELHNQLLDLNIHYPIIIFGCVNDKDVSNILSLLPPNARYILTQANIPRALDIEDLGPLFLQYQRTVLDNKKKIQDAISASIELSEEGDTIIVTGSIFVVGEALECLTVIV